MAVKRHTGEEPVAKRHHVDVQIKYSARHRSCRRSDGDRSLVVVRDALRLW